MVGQQSETVEWSLCGEGKSTSYSRDRCIQNGMGGFLPRGGHRRLLEHGGTSSPHQCSRDASCLLCSEGILEEQGRNRGPDSVGQYVSGVPHQQTGWYKIARFDKADKEKVCLVSGKANHNTSSTPSKKGKYHGRFPVQAPERQDRLDSQCRYFQSHQPNLGSATCGSFCNSFIYTTTTFFQLESRPRGGGNRCLFSEMGDNIGICTPTMVPDYKGANENTDGRSNSGANYSPMENPTLVPYDLGHDDRLPNTSSKHPRPGHPISKLQLSSVGNSAPTGCMEGLRQQFEAREIPSNAVDLILSSWRSKTNANYNSAWRKWESWCKQRGAHPFSTDVSSILGFLADQFGEGKQYRSLNCYRSALSSTHLPVEGFPVGQHPLVVRLLKGAYNQRPPKPRYSHTWDVTQMLSYLSGLGSNESLSLKMLTQKLAMLLALVLGHRSSDLVRLTLRGRSYTPEGAVLPCKGLAKQTRPGNEKSLQPVTIASFEEELLSPVACLQSYENATMEFRGKEETMQLFLAMVPPHQPVCSSTIARWLKTLLKKAGLEPSFSAHSTRSAASTAAALAGVSTQEIMSRAGWSNKDTFCRYYYRPPSGFDTARKFGEAVLTTNMHRTC